MPAIYCCQTKRAVISAGEANTDKNKQTIPKQAKKHRKGVMSNMSIFTKNSKVIEDQRKKEPIERKPTILHLDDDRDFLDVFVMVFSEWLDITSVCNGKTAFHLLEEKQFDAVITDYDMPGMDGLQFLRELRRSSNEIPIIFYTGQGNEEVAREAFILGATDYFTKDIYSFAHKEKFVNSIKNAIKKSKMEKAREESEGKFRELFHNVNDAIFLYRITDGDKPGKFIEVNDVACQRLGYSREELLNMTPADINAYLEEPQFSSYINRIKLIGRLTVEAVHKAKDGIIIPVEISTHIFSLGEDKAVLSVARDISERLKHRRILQESEEKFRLLYNEAPVPYQSLDENGNFIDVNNSWLEVMGYSKDEVIGRNFTDFMIQEDRPKFPGFFRKFKEVGEIHNRISKMVKKDGTVITAEIEGRIARDENGNFRQTHCIFQDITQKLKNEKRIRHLNRVLQAIRNVNQLIVKEKDRDILTGKICDLLTETNGYGSSWIILMDEKKNFINIHEAGVISRPDSFYSSIKAGNFPDCITCAMNEDGIIVISGREGACDNCPYEESTINNTRMSVCLKHNDRLFGVLVVSIPSFISADDEEKSLFREVADDIAYALSNLENEEKNRKMTRSLTHSEEMLREIFSNIHSGIAVYEAFNDGEDFIFRQFNNASQKIDNIKEDDLIGKSVSEVFPGVKKFGLFQVFKRVWKTGIPEHYPVTLYSDSRIKGWRDNFVFKLSTGEIVAIYDDITDLQVVRENLRIMQIAIEYSLNAIALADLDFKLTYVNRSCLALWGYENGEEVLGRSAVEFWKDAEHLQKINDIMAKDGKWTGELDAVRKDGSIFSVYLTSQVIKDLDENPVCIMTSFIDISDRRRDEKTIRESEQKYRTIFDNTGTAIVIIEENTLISLANTEFERLSGYSAKELEGKMKALDFVHPDDLELIKKNHYRRRMPEQIVPRQYEFRFVSREGTVKNVFLTIDLIPGTSQSIASLLDITHLKEIETDLRNSEEKLKTVIKNMPVMMDVFDKNLVITEWNRECERVTGYSAGEITGNPEALKILYPDTQYRENMIQTFHDMPKVFRDMETELTCKDGSKKTISWSNISDRFPIPGWDSWAIGVDVTYRKKMETQLIGKNRELNDFAYRVSHDLKNPLFVLRGFMNVIKDEPEFFNDYFPKISEKLDYLLLFIDNLLNLSRVGKIINKKERIDLKVLLTDIFNKHKVENADSEMILSEKLEPIEADPGGINSIFSNLIQNSIRYRDTEKEKVTIHINSIKEDERVRIIYRDNGIGLPEDLAEKIFEPGFTASNNKGTGFGLAIVKKVTEAHGGSISAHSEGIGKGLEFVIELPT